MNAIPKTLLDVLCLLKMEPIAREPGDAFRRFHSPSLTLSLTVYDEPVAGRLPCSMSWHDELDDLWSTAGTFDDALLWLCWRPEYRQALLVRKAS